jgi:hypothetical protein
MAKAILEFDLNEPDDVEAHKRAVKSLDMAIALWDIDQYLRAQTKYAPDSMPQEAYDALSEAREKFYQILNERNINMDEILK